MRSLVAFLVAASSCAGTISIGELRDSVAIQDPCGSMLPGTTCNYQDSYNTPDGNFNITYTVSSYNSGYQNETVDLVVTNNTGVNGDLYLDYGQPFAVSGNYSGMAAS